MNNYILKNTIIIFKTSTKLKNYILLVQFDFMKSKLFRGGCQVYTQYMVRTAFILDHYYCCIVIFTFSCLKISEINKTKTIRKYWCTQKKMAFKDTRLG